MRMGLTQKENSLINYSPPRRGKVEQGFMVHRTFQEIHNERAW